MVVRARVQTLVLQAQRVGRRLLRDREASPLGWQRIARRHHLAFASDDRPQGLLMRRVKESRVCDSTLTKNEVWSFAAQHPGAELVVEATRGNRTTVSQRCKGPQSLRLVLEEKG